MNVGTESLPSADWASLYVAKQEGFFKKAGVSVKIIPFHTLTPALAALHSGEVQFMVSGTQGFLVPLTRGFKLVAVGSLMDAETFNLIVGDRVLARLHISPSTPLQKRYAALRGLTFGVLAPGGVVDLMTRDLLKAGGLTVGTAPGDVHVISLGSDAAEAAAVRQGEIAGFASSGVAVERAVTQHWGQALIPNTDVPGWTHIESQVVFCGSSYATQHPSVVRAIASGIAEANGFIRSHPGQAAHAIASYFSGLSANLLQPILAQEAPSLPTGARMTQGQWQAAIKLVQGLGAIKGHMSARQGVIWTNRYLPSS